MRGHRPPLTDETGEFRALVRKYGEGVSGAHPPHADASVSQKQHEASAAWTREATQIKQHISSLFRFLSTIRRAYLYVAGKGRRAVPESTPPSDVGEGTDAFAKWQRVHSLTDAERDEIDFQVKLVIKQCLDRVQGLERGEQLRSQATQRALAKARASPLSFLHGSALQQQQAASAQVAAHHAGVTQYLSELLARASAMQAALQQQRVETQRQRHAKLADGAKATARMAAAGADADEALCGTVSSMGDDDVAAELDQAQLQLFEEEASALLQSLASDLQAIQHAERQLHDISELQTRIVQHLQEQNEHTDTLRTEAASHGEQVTSGNTQLRQAKERNRLANRFLAIFFVISGLVLLFMHCELLGRGADRSGWVDAAGRPAFGWSACNVHVSRAPAFVLGRLWPVRVHIVQAVADISWSWDAG
ncbi:hypothetical protein MSPP1_001213 [Malassezia sp. CBS 17886]|nr:hypothetical protein MSPP1_001213 [Malassezia sp. CBS 17886]